MNLSGLFSRAPQPSATFPDGRVGFAVGDVHGRADLLDKLLTDLEARLAVETRNGRPPMVIYLGDYVDRGADSRGAEATGAA